MMNLWTQRFPYRTFNGELDAFNSREYLAILASRDGRGAAHHWDLAGTCMLSFDEVHHTIKNEFGGILVSAQYDDEVRPVSLSYVTNDGAIDFSWDEEEQEINLSIATRSTEEFDRVTQWAIAHVSREPPKGTVYALMSRRNNIVIDALDVAGQDLDRINYTDEALEQFDRVVEEWNQDAPSGRLVLLDGPPGTGKTYAVRGFLNAVEKTTCVMIPPAQFEALTDPNLLPVLVDFTRGLQDRRLLFIIEDADAALMSRGPDNVGVLSVLLNMADGIVGAALNIRILATTNARVDDLDEAVRRPGRLLEHIHLGPLPEDKAKIVLDHLNPDAALPDVSTKSAVGFGSGSIKREYTLAEIYKASRARQGEGKG